MPARLKKIESLVLQELPVFRRQLLSWYQTYRRKLPWRENPSLYKTVVSEFMLQQTQVETVLPYFERWMKVFPGFKGLAQAPGEKVLKQWEGLGYYSRARNLHRLALALAGLKRIPRSADAWLQFPGVGPYTAAAITSISFNAPAAVVDGNVIRVISRLCAEPGVFIGNSEAVKQLKPIADLLLDKKSPGDYNQAMMELGATLCVRSKPRCLICPVRKLCASYASSNPEAYPRFEKRKTEQVQIDRLWVLRNGALLLQQAPKQSSRLSEIYELPRREIVSGAEKAFALLAVKKRAISNQQVQERIFSFSPSAAQLKALGAEELLSWVPVNRLDSVILSGPHRRWIAELLFGVRPQKI